MELQKTLRGFTYLPVTRQDCLSWGGFGVCDFCNQNMQHGYLVHVLNSCICSRCEWIELSLSTRGCRLWFTISNRSSNRMVQMAHNELVLGQAGPNKRSIRKEVNRCSSSITFILTPGSYLTERQWRKSMSYTKIGSSREYSIQTPIHLYLLKSSMTK